MNSKKEKSVQSGKIKKKVQKTYLFCKNTYIYLYIQIQKDMDVKLTSVKILKDLYSSFKRTTLDDKMSLQKLVNRSLTLYVEDPTFKKKIDSFGDLQISGSQF